MTPDMENHLRGMTDAQRKRLAATSRKMLRDAWPNRHTNPTRAGIVIRSNVTMLRNLRATA